MGRERSVCSPMKDIAVEYLGGSGFLVTIGQTGFLFDASEHGADKRILPEKEALSDFDKLYVFKPTTWDKFYEVKKIGKSFIIKHRSTNLMKKYQF